MPRRIRLFVAGGVYHVYCRVSRGEHVFAHRAASQHWVETAERIAQLQQLRILAWCLMTNHYHLVVRTGNVPLWCAMARVQARVAREHNRRRSVVGPFWQSRYMARLVEKQGDLENLVAYVHLNPVKAGLVDDPASYELSGHRAMIGLRAPRLLTMPDAVLTFGDDSKSGRVTYLETLRSVAEARWSEEHVQNLPWWKQVTDRELTMANAAAPPGAAMFDGQPLPPEKDLRPFGGVVRDYFEARYGLPAGHLASPSRSPSHSQNRRLFSTLAVCWLGLPVYEVATLLLKAPGSVSRWVAEGLEQQQAEEGFLAELVGLRRDLGLLLAVGDAERLDEWAAL